jgi:hypothetical protein
MELVQLEPATSTSSGPVFVTSIPQSSTLEPMANPRSF